MILIESLLQDVRYVIRTLVLALMMRESARPVIAGLPAGLVLATGAAHPLRGVLYGLNTVDAGPYGGACFLFLIIALIAASWWR